MPTIDLRRRLTELDAKIAEHRQAAHQLEQARIALEHELHDTATFPVLTLPVEITAKIFVHCLPPVANLGWCYPSIDGYKNAAPIILTSVCHTWRNIALTTAALWSTVDVPFDILPPNLASQPTSGEDFIDKWLARAGQRPLSFIFRSRAGWGEDNVEPLPSRIRDIIHRYSHRLRYLELYITEPQMRYLGLDSVEFPLLESASLNCDVPGYHFPIQSQPPPVNVLGNAPRLYELVRHRKPRANAVTFPVVNLRVVLPWLQPTKYDGPIQTLLIFTEALNLIELTCHLEYLEWDPPSTTITHSGLRSLTIESDWDRILERLTLPALQYLDLAQSSEPYPDDADLDLTLEDFLIRSSPPLGVLCIQADYRDSEVWCRCLGHVRSSVETIQLCGPSTEVMSSLFPWGESIISMSSFPNLRCLRLQRVSCDLEPHYYSIVQFLYSESHLRSFSLVWDANPVLDARYTCGTAPVDTLWGHLSRIVHAGMKIHVGSRNKNYVAMSD
ncbi:hypothetical protein B0H14DRAFT_2764837 [Mycena olivaceomarginata]|nr:hypothetical protein B0H14DRAFT_2764837 [Mycena olivaceomarginata]